jgi:hypothetical protein
MALVAKPPYTSDCGYSVYLQMHRHARTQIQIDVVMFLPLHFDTPIVILVPDSKGTRTPVTTSWVRTLPTWPYPGLQLCFLPLVSTGLLLCRGPLLLLLLRVCRIHCRKVP